MVLQIYFISLSSRFGLEGKLIPVLAKYSATGNFSSTSNLLCLWIGKKNGRLSIPASFNLEIKKSLVIFPFAGTKMEYIQKNTFCPFGIGRKYNP